MRFSRPLSLSLVTLLIAGGAAAKNRWEEIFSAKGDGKQILVELNPASFKKRTKDGESILTFTLHQLYVDNGKKAEAINDYEVFCVTRAAYRTKLDIKIQEGTKLPISARNNNREQLSGKDYDDFVGVMNILCKR